MEHSMHRANWFLARECDFHFLHLQYVIYKYWYAAFLKQLNEMHLFRVGWNLKRPSWACLYRSHRVVLCYFVFIIGVRTYKIYISVSIPSPIANWKCIGNCLSALEVKCLLIKLNLSKTVFCIMWCRKTLYHFGKMILLLLMMILFLFRDEEIRKRLVNFCSW